MDPPPADEAGRPNGRGAPSSASASARWHELVHMADRINEAAGSGSAVHGHPRRRAGKHRAGLPLRSPETVQAILEIVRLRKAVHCASVRRIADPPARQPSRRPRISRRYLERRRRRRYVDAAAELLHEFGREGPTVTNLVRLAGTARGSFYEVFDSAEDCIAYGIAVAADELFATLAAQDGGGEWTAELHEAVAGFYGAAAAGPILAELFLIHSAAARRPPPAAGLGGGVPRGGDHLAGEAPRPRRGRDLARREPRRGGVGRRLLSRPRGGRSDPHRSSRGAAAVLIGRRRRRPARTPPGPAPWGDTNPGRRRLIAAPPRE